MQDGKQGPGSAGRPGPATGPPAACGRDVVRMSDQGMVDPGTAAGGPPGPGAGAAGPGTADKAMDVAFLPAAENWASVSPQLRRVRRFVLAVAGLPLGLALAALLGWLLVPWAGVLAAVVVLGLVALGWVLIDLNQRSWRYAERAQDLLVSHGVVFRELVVVPYGRMQFVDVAAGPLERQFGIATVQLHTAAAATDARIPGMLPDEAARLRDRLSALGEARSAGL
jgi:uncharacterized protein